MIRKYGFSTFAAAAFLASVLAPAPAKAQLWTWSKDQMVEYTKAWTGDRFEDGRPKVPDSFLERAKGLSMEDIQVNFGGRGGGGGYGQFAGDWMVLHPGKKMVGRAVTLSFMPSRGDLDGVMREKGLATNTQFGIDKIQPGDVLVIDLFGKKENGTITGDNLFYYVYKATNGGGLVLDGSVRDLEGVSQIDLPAYIRSVHPSAVGGVTLAGYNVPIRIGGVTVMPGDLVVGDREGVSFIPPQLAEKILDTADTTRVHDEWTKKKFDEGKYKSSEIYSTPRDPALRQEYQDYLKKRLEEIRAGRK